MPQIGAKICGLSTPDTLNAAIKGGASHVGFVFFPKSPRNVDFDRLAQLSALVPDHVKKTGVFVDPDLELLGAAMAAGQLDIIQLHGKETPAQAALIARHFGVETWKAIAIRTQADLTQAAQYAGAADRLLYDAKTPPGSELPGGMGLRFDWTLLDGFRHPLPWALSGGLDVDNVAQAVAVTGAELVDVSSGVETAPGVKSVDKIAAFLKATNQL